MEWEGNMARMTPKKLAEDLMWFGIVFTFLVGVCAVFCAIGIGASMVVGVI